MNEWLNDRVLTITESPKTTHLLSKFQLNMGDQFLIDNLFPDHQLHQTSFDYADPNPMAQQTDYVQYEISETRSVKMEQFEGNGELCLLIRSWEIPLIRFEGVC